MRHTSRYVMASLYAGMTTSKRPDGNSIAQENRGAVLRWINRFGGLTSRQAARLVWQDTPSGRQMAQRTLRCLLDHHLILSRRLANGGIVYVLSERGAWALRELGAENVSSRGHRDLRFDKPMHRFLANDYVIDQHLAGRRVWTEFEVQRRLAPVPQITAGKEFKIPDAVIEMPQGLTWVEVENAYKGPERIRQLIRVAKQLFAKPRANASNAPDNSSRYTEMLFISPDILRLIAVLRQIDDAWDREEVDQDIAARLWLVEVSMSPGFIWGGVQRTVSAFDYILGNAGIEFERRRQVAVRDLLAKYEREFRVDDQLLWPLIIQVLASLDIEFDALNSTFTQQARDYDELLESPVGDRLPRSDAIVYLSSLDAAVRGIDIGFNRDSFRAVCDGVPLIPRPTFLLDASGKSPPQDDGHPSRSLYP